MWCELGLDKMRIVHSRQQAPKGFKIYAPRINPHVRNCVAVIHKKKGLFTGALNIYEGVTLFQILMFRILIILSILKSRVELFQNVILLQPPNLA